jgi:hypothetical protein
MAHTLKGSSSYVHAEPLRLMMLDIEKKGKAGEGESLAEMVEQAWELFERTRAEIEKDLPA